MHCGDSLEVKQKVYATGSEMANKDTGDHVDKMVFTDFYIGLIKVTLYHILHAVVNMLQFLIWVVNGTMVEHWSSYKAEHFSTAAHVYDIIYRYKFDVILGQSSFTDFVLTHDKFVHPMYLLRDECVLYQVTGSHAIFVEVDQGVDIWRGKHGSFLRQAQFQQAKKVITLPLPALERLAESLGPNEAKVIFIQNTARCGSTLLIQMFENTGRCVSFSEPDAMNGICKLAVANKMWDKKTGTRIVRNLARVLCKPVYSLKEPPLAYIIKMTAPSMAGAPFLVEAFPEAHHMFMYRDVVKMSHSLAIAAEVMPTLKLVYLCGTISSWCLRFAVSQMGVPNNEFNLKLSSHPYGVGIVLYGVTARRYMKMLHSGMNIAGVRYEDLIEDADYFMTQVLKFCRLPISLGMEAVKASKKDSQANSPLSMSNLKTFRKNYKMVPEMEEYIKDYFKDLGLPVCPAPVLRGTITHKYMTSDGHIASSTQKPTVKEAVEKLLAEVSAAKQKASPIKVNAHPQQITMPVGTKSISCSRESIHDHDANRDSSDIADILKQSAVPSNSHLYANNQANLSPVTGAIIIPTDLETNAEDRDTMITPIPCEDGNFDHGACNFAHNSYLTTDIETTENTLSLDGELAVMASSRNPHPLVAHTSVPPFPRSSVSHRKDTLRVAPMSVSFGKVEHDTFGHIQSSTLKCQDTETHSDDLQKRKISKAGIKKVKLVSTLTTTSTKNDELTTTKKKEPISEGGDDADIHTPTSLDQRGAIGGGLNDLFSPKVPAFIHFDM